MDTDADIVDVLLESINRLALNETDIAEVNRTLRRVVSLPITAIGLYSRRQGRYTTLVSDGHDEAMFAPYVDYYQHIDPRFSWPTLVDGSGNMVLDEVRIPADQRRNHAELYEWLESFDHGLQYVAMQPFGSDLVARTILVAPVGGEISHAQKTLLSRLNPLLVSAMNSAQRLQQGAQAAQGYDLLLEHLDIGCIGLNAEAQPIFANRVARTLFRRGDLRLSTAGLTCNSPQVDQQIAALCRDNQRHQRLPVEMQFCTDRRRYVVKLIPTSPSMEVTSLSDQLSVVMHLTAEPLPQG